MASDVRLKNDEVLVEGGNLKIEKSAYIEENLFTKGLIVSSTGRQSGAALRVRTNRNNEISIQARIIRIGENDGRVRVRGVMSAEQLSSRNFNSPNIQSSKIKIGYQSGSEDAGRAGILTLINEQGDEVITFDAGNKKINVSGVGDLLEKIQLLEEKVENLEQQIGS